MTLEILINPMDYVAVIINFIDTFGFWLESELESEIEIKFTK